MNENIDIHQTRLAAQWKQIMMQSESVDFDHFLKSLAVDLETVSLACID